MSDYRTSRSVQMAENMARAAIQHPSLASLYAGLDGDWIEKNWKELSSPSGDKSTSRRFMFTVRIFGTINEFSAVCEVSNQPRGWMPVTCEITVTGPASRTLMFDCIQPVHKVIAILR
jgi:hypothetical protein